MNIRPIETGEYGCLEDFLYLAVFVPLGHEALSHDIIYAPEIYVYIDGFGKPDDACYVAEADGAIVGAAWARILADPGQEGYGNIGSQTPELAISVLPEYRGRGIGAGLIGALANELKGRGYAQLSLSVQKDNPAVWLYRRTGFREISENAEDYIMALNLQDSAAMKELG